MKLKYETPTMDVKAYAQFENVFTYCTKGNPGIGCIDVTSTGNDEDKYGLDPSQSAAFSGGGDGSGGGAGSGI